MGKVFVGVVALAGVLLACVGPAGPAGTSGEVGPRGPRGERGEVGPVGEVGPRGPQGEWAEFGPTGRVRFRGPGLVSDGVYVRIVPAPMDGHRFLPHSAIRLDNWYFRQNDDRSHPVLSMIPENYLGEEGGATVIYPVRGGWLVIESGDGTRLCLGDGRFGLCDLDSRGDVLGTSVASEKGELRFVDEIVPPATMPTAPEPSP